MPATKMRCTAADAFFKVAKLAEMVARAGGCGSRRRVASVTIPSSPSDPTKSEMRSKPVLFLWVRLPVRRMSPLARTTSSPRT